MPAYKDFLLAGTDAVCIVDAELNIKQYNSAMSMLIGQRDRHMIGENLSSIMYDEAPIGKLLLLDSLTDWLQGGCVLKTFNSLPLAVNFLAGKISEPDSEQDGYVLIFRQLDETQRPDYTQRDNALLSLLNLATKPGMKIEDFILDLARAFDPYAEIKIIPPGSHRQNMNNFDEHAMATIRLAIERKRAMFYKADNLSCVFPIYSQNELYGVACIKFVAPRLYNDLDKKILSLAGLLIGTYIETQSFNRHGNLSNSIFKTIFDSINQAIFIVDTKGVVINCNKAAQVIYGYSELESIGRVLGDLIFPADSMVYYNDMLTHLMKGNSVKYEEMVHLCKNWNTVNISVSAFPYKSDSGILSGAIFICDSLAQTKYIGDKIIQWKRLVVLGELISSIANELNNLATPIVGYMQMLLQNKEIKTDTMLSNVYNEAKKLDSFLLNLFDMVHDDMPHREKVNINEILSSVISLKENQLKASNIDVTIKLADNVPIIMNDSRDIYILFLRLINYSERRMLEYSNGGHLDIETAVEDGKIIIWFSDTGTCILQDELAEVVNPFSLFTKTSMNNDILDTLGASLAVDCDFGKANTISIEMPATEEIVDDLKAKDNGYDIVMLDVDSQPFESFDDTTTKNLEMMVHNIKPAESKSVIVVDDNPNIVELLTHILGNMGFSVDIAQDGNEAMEKLNVEKYDLIISDLKMPGGYTGDKLYKFIKRVSRHLASRIIFITGDVISPETRNFLKSTGNFYLEKPFLPESLIKMVNDLMIVSNNDDS